MPASIVASLNQVSQIGVEVTPGTPVAATRRLVSLGLPLSPAREIQEFRPPGFKYSTGHVETRQWSEGSIGDGSGVSYNEIIYPLNSLLSKVTPVQQGTVAWAAATPYNIGDIRMPVGGTPAYAFMVTATSGTYPYTSAPVTEPTWPTVVGNTVVDNELTWTNIGATPTGIYDWTFDTNTFARDNIQTYTIETGDTETGRSYRAAFGFFTGLEITSTRSGEVEISGDLLANKRSSFTLTGGAASSPLIPATPSHLNVYMDTSAADLGKTLLDGNFTANISLTDRASHVWFHGRQYAGPAGRVEQPPDATFELTQADGTEVDTMLTALDAGQRQFFRFDFTGQKIGTTLANHQLIWDIAGTIGDAESWDDEDNVWAATIPFAAEHDGTWGRAMRCKVRTNVATLG